jgi:hypothetical protein
VTTDRRRQLKREGKAEIERRTQARKDESESLLHDMKAALSHSGDVPTEFSCLSEEQRLRATRERWIISERPVLHRQQLYGEFVHLPDTAQKWLDHPLSYLLCKVCSSAIPSQPKLRLFGLSGCRCGNLRRRHILGITRLRIAEESMVVLVAIFGRASPASAA